MNCGVMNMITTARSSFVVMERGAITTKSFNVAKCNLGKVNLFNSYHVYRHPLP